MLSVLPLFAAMSGLRYVSPARLVSFDLTPHQLWFSSLAPGSCYVSQGLTCVPCPLRNGAAYNLVGSLNAGLNLDLSAATDLRVGTGAITLDTLLYTNTSVQLAANGTANTSSNNTSSNLVVNNKTNAHLSGTTTNIDTSLQTDIDVDANLNTNTHTGSGSSVVVGSNANLDLSTTAKLGSDAQLDVEAGISLAASLAATATLDSIIVAAAANAVATGTAVVSVGSH